MFYKKKDSDKITTLENRVAVLEGNQRDLYYMKESITELKDGFKEIKEVITELRIYLAKTDNK